MKAGLIANWSPDDTVLGKKLIEHPFPVVQPPDGRLFACTPSFMSLMSSLIASEVPLLVEKV